MRIRIFYCKIFKIFFLRFLLYTATLYIHSPFSIFAQNPQEIIKEQDWITRQQQNIIDEKQKELEINENFHKQKSNNDIFNKNNIKDVESKIEKCIEIKKINLIGANLLSTYQKHRLTSSFIGKCIDTENLSLIIKTINEYYYDKGFVTTQIKVPEQNLKIGIFNLEIIEGKIEKIILNNDNFLNKMQKFTAFGYYNNKILNIDDINQGIYQINRLTSNNAVIKILPGNNIGNSIIDINNSKKFPVKFSIINDNLGNDFTGIYRTNFTSNIDNLISFNDNLNLNYTTNLVDNNNKKNIESFSSSFSIPYKYNTFSYDFFHSKFKGQNKLASSIISLTGYSQISKITFDHIFINKSFLKSSLNTSLIQKSSATYLNDSKLSNSERRLSILNLAFLTLTSYKNINIIINPSYSKGLKILNAKKDSPSTSKIIPKAQFDVFKIYANFSKKILLPNNYGSFFLNTEMSGQYSKQTLFGSEQFSVGGYFSVRGFRENYINGDSGYLLRNKITYNLGQLLTSSKKTNSNNKNNINLYNFSLEPFYDYGYVKNKFTDNASSGRLSGTGLKTLFNTKYFSTSLTYSWAIGKSNLITSNIKENRIIYFEISMNCC